MQTIDEQITAEEASGTRCNWRTSNRFDEQATGEQATCEPATGEQTTGEHATGEQAIGALKRSFLTEVPMLVFTFKSCLLNKQLFIVEVHSLYSKSSNLTVGTSNCHALDHQHHPQHDHQQQLQQQSQHLLSKENT